MGIHLTSGQLDSIARSITAGPPPLAFQPDLVSGLNESTLIFDPRRRDFQMNPYPVFAKFRAQEPVHFSSLYRGWLLFRYDDVAQLCSDETTFSAAVAGATTGRGLFRLDEPEHAPVLARVFGAWQAAAPDAKVAALVESSLDAALAAIGTRSVFDLVDDFARPVPRKVYYDILGGAGISESQRSFLDANARQVMKFHNHLLDPVQRDQERVHALELLNFFIEALRRLPGDRSFDDSFLAHLAPVIGEPPFTLEVALTTLVNLTVAGYMSVEFLLATGIRRLLLDDAAGWQAVQAAPARLAGYLEEMRRTEHALAVVDRFVKVDGLTMRGVSIPKGSAVYGVLASANRDETKFDPGADEFNPARTVTHKRLGLGHGTHECMGRGLEPRITVPAFSRLIQAMPNLRLVSPAQPPWFDNFYFRSFDHLNVMRV